MFFQYGLPFESKPITYVEQGMVFDFKDFSECFRHKNREMSKKQNCRCDYGPKKATLLVLFFLLALLFAPLLPCAPVCSFQNFIFHK